MIEDLLIVLVKMVVYTAAIVLAFFAAGAALAVVSTCVQSMN